MQQRSVGRSGLRVSRIGLGTMTWGRDTDEHEAREMLTDFVEAGGTLVDTAAAYAGGRSEELIGALLDDAVRRDDVVLASKAGVGSRSAVRRGDGRDTSRAGLLADLDASLRRLRVDHLDLWQVHVWSDAVPLEETLATLAHAVDTGRVRYAGISNYTAWQSSWAAALQRERAPHAALVSHQTEYSLLERTAELDAVPAAHSLGMGVLAWSPLGRGVLTGKYRSGTPSDSRAASSHLASFVEPYLDDRARGIVESVCKAADGLGWTPAEVALSWVRDRPGVSSAIVGARTAAQLRGTLQAEQRELPYEVADALDEVSSRMEY